MAINQNRNSVRVLRTTVGSCLAHKNIPNLHIGGGSEFTIQLWVVTGKDLDGVLYSQEGGFSIQLLDGQVVFTLDGFAALRSGESWVLSPHAQSSIAVRYQGETLTLFLGGVAVAQTQTCAKAGACTGDYAIGKQFTGGFSCIRVSDTARSDKAILSDNAVQPAVDSHCVFQSDCSTAQYQDVSANHLPMWSEGVGAGCGICTACTVFGRKGQVSCTPLEPLDAAHTLLLKFWPQDQQRTQCLYTAMDGDKTLYTVELIPQDDHTFRLTLTSGSGGKAAMSKTLLPELWQDAAAVFDGGKVKLYLNGTLDGEYSFSFSGKRSDILVGSEYEKGKPYYEKGFCGYMAYTAEFNKVLSAEEIALYADDPPFMFEDGLVSLLPLDWPGVVEAVGVTPLRVVGSAPFNLVPDITPRDGDIGCSMRIPTTISPYWNTLSTDEQWALELLASLLQEELTAMCGYSRVTQNDQDPSIVKCIAKPFARHHEQEWVRLRKMSPADFNAGDTTRLLAADLSEPANVALTSAPGTAGGIVTAASGGVTGFVSSNATAIVGTAAGVGAAAAVAAIVISAEQDRPSSQGTLKVTGICWNHKGDPARGGLHYHKGGADLPASMTDVPGPNHLDTLCVLVPSRLTAPTLDVTLTYTTTETTPKTGTLKGCDIPPNNLLGEHSVAYTVSPNSSVTVSLPFDTAQFPQGSVEKRGHTWQLWDGGEHLINCACTFYFLPEVPIAPWAVNIGTDYQTSEKNYIRLELLDFFMEKGTDRTDAAKLCTQALNSCDYFQYDRTDGATYYVILSQTTDAHLLKLEKLLSHLQAGAHPINCVDCSCIVSAGCAMAGKSLPMAVFWGGRLHPEGFTCNQVVAIGYSVWDDVFEGDPSFAFHQFNVNAAAAPVPDTAQVYDACLKVDGGEFPGLNNPVGKTPLLPLGLPAKAAGNQVYVPTDQPYTGNLYRERLVANGETCIFEEDLMNVEGFSTDIQLPRMDASPAPVLPGIQAIMERFALDTLPAPAGTPLARWDAVPLAGATLNESAPGYGDWTVGGESPVWVERRFCSTAQETARCMAGVLFNVAHPDIRTGEETGVSLGERCFLFGASGVLFCRRGNVFTVTGGQLQTSLATARALDESVQAQ